MPLTTDQLTQAFNDAGFDTPEKVTAMLAMANLQMTLRAKQIALAALDATQATAIAGINAQRATLQTAINDLAAQINAQQGA